MSLHTIELLYKTSYDSLMKNPAKAFDNSFDTYAYSLDTSTSVFLYTLQGDVINEYISQGAVIKSVRAKVYMQGGTAHSARLVVDATAYNKYTDCGDGSISFTAVEGWNTIEFPVGTEYCKNNINKLLSGLVGVRLVVRAKNIRIYEARAEVVLEIPTPTITVTTSVSPEGVGAVMGGGTYDSGSTVTCTATPNTGYVFSYWLVNGANAGNSNPISGALTSDTTVTAVFEKQTYTIRWYNEDGTLLETDTTEYGVMPTYDGVTPTKSPTAQYTYTFKGWHIEPSVVTSAIDYYARYTETTNKYTVLWKNDDGTVLEVDTTEYGKIPTYDSATPTKPSTVQYTYTFLGWDTTIEEVTRDVVYTALYNETVNMYLIEALSTEGGYVVGGGYCAYGSQVQLITVANDGYRFVAWSDGYAFPGRTVEVLGDATYTAIFEKTGDSKVYKGTKTVSVYKGIKKVSVYIGTKKIS